MKRRNLVLVMMAVLLLVGSVSVFAQGGQEKADNGNVKVVAIVKKLSSSFWTDMKDGIEAQAGEYGWDVEVLCPVNETNEEQIQLLEMALLDPPDAFLITPVDSKGIAPVIEKINEAGIPIINFNTKISADDVDVETFVGVEYKQLAITAAEAIAKKVDYTANILMIEGTTGSQTAIDMKEGANSFFAKYDGLKVIDSMPANYRRADSLNVTQNLLQKHADVDVIFACNGEMALGAAEAVRQSGRKGIMIATLNMSDEIAQAIQDGTITLTVDDDSTNVGKQAVVAAKKVLDGIKLPAESMQDGIIVDYDALDPYRAKYGIN